MAVGRGVKYRITLKSEVKATSITVELKHKILTSVGETVESLGCDATKTFMLHLLPLLSLASASIIVYTAQVHCVHSCIFLLADVHLHMSSKTDGEVRTVTEFETLISTYFVKIKSNVRHIFGGQTRTNKHSS